MSAQFETTKLKANGLLDNGVLSAMEKAIIAAADHHLKQHLLKAIPEPAVNVDVMHCCLSSLESGFQDKNGKAIDALWIFHLVREHVFEQLRDDFRKMCAENIAYHVINIKK